MEYEIGKSLEDGGLLESEMFWRDHQKWLQETGYQLRPRYRPDWVPSWKQNGKSRFSCEDGRATHMADVIMDALRIVDGKPVALKKVPQDLDADEVGIGLFFSTPPLAANPRNHCIPIYEVLEVPDDDNLVLIVMPALRRHKSPRFDTYGEILEYFRQVFEGLHFMHEHGVAHRDCCTTNIMMDATDLYPQGYHPIHEHRKRDFTGSAKHYGRTECSPKYYLIDFGLSRQYDPANKSPRALPIRGGDKTVPEFRNALDEPYDPFPTDVYYIGNMIRANFLVGDSWNPGVIGLEFMDSLVSDMVQSDPSKRPTMDEAVARFEEIRRSLSSWKLRSRAVYRKDLVPGLGIYRAVPHWGRRISYIVRRIPPVPIP